MKATVEVTQDDIDRGVPCASGMCPIALALKRKLNLDRGVRVDFDHMELWGDGGWAPRWEAKLPRSARRFVKHYDAGLEVGPFAFELEVPGERG